MSDDGTAEDGAADAETTLSTDTLDARLDDTAEALEAAETEADLDDVEQRLDAIDSDLEAADLPEADDEEEDDPETELSDRLSKLRDDLEEQRGPYAEDVIGALNDARGTIEDTRWTEDGMEAVLAAVRTFTEAAAVGEFSVAEDTEAAALATLEEVADAVADADLDPDEDAETIGALIEESDDLAAAVEDAEEWEDLSVREMLDFHGFYDVLDHRKDFPPEWHALKVFERDGDAEKILVALDLFESDFMERHCMEALERMGPEAEAAVDEMLSRAERRNNQAISILGKIGSEEAADTLVEFVDADSDPQLQKATFRALGEIGAAAAVQPLANQLVADSEETRSRAARALGLIGDTRAVDPLADVLADDDSDTVRASAAWALRQIGTDAALSEVADYADDRAYLVQAEAEKAV
jgi:hypothetical protein